MDCFKIAAFASLSLLILPACGTSNGSNTPGTPPPPPPPSRDAGIDAPPPATGDSSMEDSGSQGDAGPTPTVPDGGLSLCPASQLLITTSNFTTAQTATLQLADQTTRVGSQDGEDENFDADSRPVRLACSGAILERTMGRLRVLSADDPFTTSQLIDLNRFNDESSMCETDADCECPAGIPSCGNTGLCVIGRCSRTSAVLPTAAWQTLDGYVYVIGEKINAVYVVNPEVSGFDPDEDDIDLSDLVKPEDSDGSVDPIGGIMIGRRLYVALGNYWFDSSSELRFSGSQLAVIDIPTRTLFLDETVELEGDNPWRGLVHIPETDELWVVSTGGPATDDGLIEAVDLVNGVSDRVLLREERLPGNLEGLAYIQPDIAYVLSAGGLYLWNPMTGTLSDTALATGLSRGVYSHDGVVYAWGESGMRLFEGVSGMELTSGSPIVFGSRPIEAAVAAP